MLVVSRKINQTIKIGESITVMLVEIRGDKVRIGIEAPKNVAIVRDDAIKTEAKE